MWVCGCVDVPQDVCAGQKTTFGNWCSPPTMQVPGIKSGCPEPLHTEPYHQPYLDNRFHQWGMNASK